MFEFELIKVMKKEFKDKSIVEYHEQYENIDNLIYFTGNPGAFDKTTFIPKRIVVFQMDFTEEGKQQQKENEIHLNNLHKESLIKLKQNFNYEMNQVEQLLKKKASQIIFDSTIDDWKIDTSTFRNTLIGKKQIALIFANSFTYNQSNYRYFQGYYFDMTFENDVEIYCLNKKCAYFNFTDIQNIHCHFIQKTTFIRLYHNHHLSLIELNYNPVEKMDCLPNSIYFGNGWIRVNNLDEWIRFYVIQME